MSRYNRHMESHFSGCVLLAETHDNCRKRDVRVFALPGEFENVGVSDGTDAWIAPVAADPFSVSAKRLLDQLKAGTLHVVKRRERVQVAPQQPKARVRVQVATEQPVVRRRTRVNIQAA